MLGKVCGNVTDAALWYAGCVEVEVEVCLHRNGEEKDNHSTEVREIRFRELGA